MNKEDMILISVDDHTVEPPNMFKNHLAKKYIDDAPRLVPVFGGDLAMRRNDLSRRQDLLSIARVVCRNLSGFRA